MVVSMIQTQVNFSIPIFLNAVLMLIYYVRINFDVLDLLAACNIMFCTTNEGLLSASFISLFVSAFACFRYCCEHYVSMLALFATQWIIYF